MRHGSRALVALTPILAVGVPAAAATPAPLAEVTVVVTSLRNAKGQVLACLTAQPRAFPDCRKDPAARTAIVPAGPAVRIQFAAVPAGRYAISLIHDENANRKMDMALVMPKEGYGFSRDAAVTMGPPKFDKAAFDVAGAAIEQKVRMRYIL